MKYFQIVFDLWKAAHHLYDRRVPYTDKNGRKRYKYYYRKKHLHGRGMGAIEDIMVGSSYEYTGKNGQRGHVHVTSTKNGVTVKHDETGEVFTFSDKKKFSEWIKRHHADAITEAKKELLERIRRERKQGSIRTKLSERRAAYLGLEVPKWEKDARQGLIKDINDFSHLRYRIVLKDKAGRNMPKWVTQETAEQIVKSQTTTWNELEEKKVRYKKDNQWLEPKEETYREHEVHLKSFNYSFEIPHGAIHPRDFDNHREIKVWVRAKGADKWRTLYDAESPDLLLNSRFSSYDHRYNAHGLKKAHHHFLMVEGKKDITSVGTPNWKTLIYHAEEHGLELVFADSETRIFDSRGTKEGVSLSAGLPPNFLALDLSKFDFEIEKKATWANYMLNENPDLRDLGFFDALGKNESNRNFIFGLIARASKGDRLGEGARQKLAKPISRLANWWAGLNDDEREKFYYNYLNLEEQFTGTLRHPLHENAQLEIPSGMEKMKEKGWSFHEYQKKAINFALAKPRVVWAMEMGLGKTLSALGLYKHLKSKKETKRMIVTAPLSAHGSWIEHLSGLSDVKYEVLSGASKKKRLAAYEKFKNGEIDVLVINPETIRKPKPNAKSKAGDFAHITQLVDQDTLFIADEVHKYKADSSQGLAFGELSAQAGRVVGMTGTPKPNKPIDFYNIMARVNPNWDISQEDFEDRYCLSVSEDVPTQYGTKTIKTPVTFNPARLNEFHHLNAEMLFVRSTNDPDAKLDLPNRIDIAPALNLDKTQTELITVLGPLCEAKAMARRYIGHPEPERLPPQFRQAFLRTDSLNADMVKCINEPSYFKEIIKKDNERAQEILAWSMAVSGMDSLAIRLDQIAVDPAACSAETKALFEIYNPEYETPKMGVIADAAVEHLETNPETGAVLFCEYVGGLREAKEALVKRGIPAEQIELYYGAVSSKKRREIEQRLNEGEIKVILGQTKALETGANLQKRANFVAHLNTPWAPDTLTQSTARVYRQGQRRKTTILRPTGSEIERVKDRVVTSKISQAAQAAGRVMVADEGAIRTTADERRQLSDLNSIASLLGIKELENLNLDAQGDEIEQREQVQQPQQEQASDMLTAESSLEEIAPAFKTKAQKKKLDKGQEWFTNSFDREFFKNPKTSENLEAFYSRMKIVAERKGDLIIEDHTNKIIDAEQSLTNASFWAGVYATAHKGLLKLKGN